VSGELTYGLERLAMYVQGVENVYDLNFNGREGADKVTYGDIFLQAEQEYSRHNFEYADTDMLFKQFQMAEGACRKYLEDGWKAGHNQNRHLMAQPAYDQCIKASHVFNLLDARGVISVTERQSYILRVRELAKACGEAWLATEGEGPHDRPRNRRPPAIARIRDNSHPEVFEPRAKKKDPPRGGP
jgi:glycyl-tRNA synthetase alpha chain